MQTITKNFFGQTRRAAKTLCDNIACYYSYHRNIYKVVAHDEAGNELNIALEYHIALLIEVVASHNQLTFSQDTSPER